MDIPHSHNTQDHHIEGIWFVYDGDCPICTMAAQALRIKKEYGALHLLNAREATEHPLVHDINKQQLDLDEGMVIYANNEFYHGDNALEFMAKYGAPKNGFMTFCKSLFWSRTLAKILYPIMRASRNLLLRIKKVEKINNLRK